MTTDTLPPLYKQPEMLNPESHGNNSLKVNPDFGFAHATNALPIVLEEFGAICKDYALVFAKADVPVPLVILGLEPNHNAFVNDKGQWAANTYVPAYVRRYPFIFAETEGNDTLTLCIDKSSDKIEVGRHNAFFDEQNQVTALTQNALEFCKNYHLQTQQTIEFCRVLQETGLLTEQYATLTLSEGQKATLSGFQVVDEQKLRELPAETVQKFFERGWLGLIYAHLISMGSMNKLVEQLKTNPAPQKIDS